MIPLKYLAKRIITLAISVLLGISLVFFIPRLSPHDPVQEFLMRLEMQEESWGSEGLVDAYVEKFGLDKSYWAQFVLWVSNVFRGDLGLSLMYYPSTVMSVIKTAVPWSIGLLSVTTVIGWVFGNFLGAMVGWFAEKSKWNWVLAYVSIFLNRIPYYILALLLIMVFCFYIPILPSGGGMSYDRIFKGITLDYIMDIIYHATLPALSLILVSLGGSIVAMRSLIVNVKAEDFIVFAQARGLNKWRIMYKYAFRNAMLPAFTGLIMGLGGIVGGSMIIEWLFSYPGLGTYAVNAIKNYDYNVIQGITLFTITATMTATFILDMVYPLVDPRITYEKK